MFTRLPGREVVSGSAQRWLHALWLLPAAVVACSAGEASDPDPFTPVVGAAGSGGAGPVGAAGAPAVSGGAGFSALAGSSGGAASAGGEGNPPVAGLGGSSASTSAGSAGSTGGTGDGGSAGAAGTAALAGAGGSPAGAGGSGTTLGSCTDGAILCDDFESASVGAFPDSGVWDPNSCTSHVVDDSVAHGGTRSLRAGAEQYPACMAHANIASESEVYARSWIQLGAASSESGHEIGFLEFGPTLADNPEVRVGVRNNDSVCASAPGVEVTADGVAGGERTTCSGVALDANRWYCLEVHFTRAPGSISFGVQIDGNSVVAETTYTDAIAAWNDGPLFLKLGRSSYGGNNVFPVWHDDVVVSSAPVGCAD